MSTLLNDTIVSISTALSNGAISIIRLSGDEAIDIVSKSFKGDNLFKAKSHTIHYGHIVDNGEVVDEVLVSIFLPPRSYTKEVVVEINCHGGIYVTNKVLEIMIRNGARVADKGEFTKRAYVNGRIDLTQAEAVMDMIEASSKNSLKLASIGLKGDVRCLINSIRQAILNVVVSSEANIDYPEYEDTVFKKDEILESLSGVQSQIKDCIEKSDCASKIRYGIKTAIVGKPNVGKSSLLNLLLDEDKAIVSNIAGTTRDAIEADLNVEGITLHLVDTAGIRTTSDVIEAIGVERAKKNLMDAELAILVFDNSEALTSDDLELLELTKDKARVIIVNKSDLKSNIDYKELGNYELISCLNKEDVNRVRKAIVKAVSMDKITDLDATFISSARQIGLLKDADDALSSAVNLISDEREIDLIALELYRAYDAVSAVIGEADNTDFVDEIFKRFCLGK